MTICFFAAPSFAAVAQGSTLTFGAVLVTWLQATLSDITDVWRLCFGLLFIGMAMFAPEGLAGLLVRRQPLLQGRQLHRVALFYLLALAAGRAAFMRSFPSPTMAVNSGNGRP